MLMMMSLSPARLNDPMRLSAKWEGGMVLMEVAETAMCLLLLVFASEDTKEDGGGRPRLLLVLQSPMDDVVQALLELLVMQPPLSLF
jgi:hypothetical protein